MLTTSAILTTIFVINTFACVVILLTNPKRSQNRAFALFASVMSLWILFVLGVIHAKTSVLAEFYIRGASIAGALIPLMFYMLCVSIAYPPLSPLSQFFKAKLPIALFSIISIICCTRLFLEGVELPSASGEEITVPEALYGPGFILFTAYFPVAFSISIYKFFKFLRKSRGVQRVELQFVLTAILLAIPISLLIHLAAFLLKSSQPQQFGPISIIPINLVIAYGIATRRILEVGTFLRKITSYFLLTIYLISVYLIALLALNLLLSNITLSIHPNIPLLIATLAVAFSIAPAHGRLQKVADKLVSSQTMDIPATMKKAGDIFQSVTTIDALLHQFSDLLLPALGADEMQILLTEGSGYVQQYPKEDSGNIVQLPEMSAIAEMIRRTRDAITGDALVRMRQTPTVKAVLHEIEELGASVVAGVFAKSNLAGIVLLGPRIGGRIYGKNEQDALQILCNQFAVALENAQMYTEMQDSKIRNEIMLDQLVSGVIVADPERKVALINNEAQRITGLAEEQALGKDLSLLPTPIAKALETTLQTKAHMQNSNAVLFPKEEEKGTHIRMGSAYLLGHDEKPMGALLVFTDMTEVKSLEEQVRRSDQLSSVGTLAAGMAHEIKNPLVTIKTFTQLLPKRHDDETFRNDFSSLVAHEVNRIDSIVNQLLSFSKPTQPHLMPMRLHETVEKTLKLIHEQLSQKNITLNHDLRAKHDLISGDADLLTQTLVNLNLNAIEAIERDGTIKVSTSNCKYRFIQRDNPDDAVTKPCVRLRISDTGEGIEPSRLNRIFDPFFTSKSEGTGMGLSVAHGIILEHHGAIEVDSKPGKGTTFSIYIPILEEGEAA
ncbi:MAG: ATP-binding protein [Verrucomicrobiota bacterium]